MIKCLLEGCGPHLCQLIRNVLDGGKKLRMKFKIAVQGRINLKIVHVVSEIYIKNKWCHTVINQTF